MRKIISGECRRNGERGLLLTTGKDPLTTDDPYTTTVLVQWDNLALFEQTCKRLGTGWEAGQLLNFHNFHYTEENNVNV